MVRISDAIRRFKADESGASLVEYTVLIGLITVALVAIILTVSGQIQAIWGKLSSTLGTIPVS